MRTNAQVILFCGLPGTLKTYLSVRLSGMMGYGYLPTRAAGIIDAGATGATLYKSRMVRYKKIGKVVQAAISLGADIVVDGGFPTVESRATVLKSIQPGNVMIVHCVADEAERLKRLRKRADDKTDYESSSAKVILKEQQEAFDPTPKEVDPLADLKAGKVKAVLKADTTGMKLKWHGTPPETARQVMAILKQLFKEYEQTVQQGQQQQISNHFNDLSPIYDDSTQWRKDKKILKALQVANIPAQSKILDIGTGTGLATEWYTQKGHTVAGVDISPQMLQKAAERLTFVLLANATKLPFLNNYFDMAIVRQCLHYTEPLPLLAEAARTIKPGGSILVSSAVCPNEAVKNFWREFKNATQPLRLEVFTADDICQLLTLAGFKVITVTNNTVNRNETLASIKKRAHPVQGGLNSFLHNMRKLSGALFPELKFSYEKGSLTYRQYWATVLAVKK